jgi:hypothetical protein
MDADTIGQASYFVKSNGMNANHIDDRKGRPEAAMLLLTSHFNCVRCLDAASV